MRDAACAGHGTDLWFGETRTARRQAREVCATCPVRSECFEFAVAERIRCGVWGGVDMGLVLEEQRQERRRVRVRARRAGAA